MLARSSRVRIARIGAGLALGLALLVSCAHLPPVRTRVLAMALGQLAPYGIEGEALDLDYNLVTLTMRVRGLSLAAKGEKGTPFFEAREVYVDLPWSSAWHGLAIDSLTIIAPRLRVARTAEGALNLPSVPDRHAPAAGQPAPPGATAIRIGRVEVRDLGASFEDSQAALDVAVSGVELALEPQPGGGTAGALTLEGLGSLRWRDRQTTVSAVEGRLLFDGTRLSLTGMRLALDEGELRLAGRIGVLEALPDLDLSYDATIDLLRASRWVQPPAPVAGTLRLSGQVTGPMSDPVVSVAVATDDLVLSSLRNASLRASLRLSQAEAVLASFALNAAGGHIQGDGRVDLASGGMPGAVAVSWHDLDACTLISAASPASAVAPVSRLTGNLRGQWTALSPDRIALKAENVARSGRTPALSAGLDGSMSLGVGDGRWIFNASHRLGDAVEVVAALNGTLASEIGETTVAGRVTARSPDLARAMQAAAAVGITSGPPGSSLRGRGDVELALAGTLSAPRFTGTLQAEEVGLGAFGPVALDARFSGSNREVQLDRLDAWAGPNRASASARLALDSQQLAGSASVEISDLARFAALAPPSLKPAGSIGLTLQVSGRATNPSVEAAVSGSRLTLAGQRFDSLSASLGIKDQTVTAYRIELQQAEGRLVAGGRYDIGQGTYTVRASGRGLQLFDVPSAEQGAEPLALSGVFDLDLEGAGSLDEPTGRATLDASALSAGGFEVGAVRTEVEAANRQLHVTSTIGELGTTLTGHVDLGAASRFTLNAAVDEADLAAVLGRIGRPLERPIRGTLSLGIEASGNVDRLADTSVMLDLRALDAALDSLPLRLATSARLVYRGADRTLEVEPLDIRIGDTNLRLRGRLGNDPSASLVVGLDGEMRDLAALLRFVPQEAGSVLGGLQATGAVAIEARVRGPLERPVVEADARIAEGRVEVRDLPPVTAVALRASYRDGVIRLQELGASWQQATLAASGRLPARLLAEYLPAGYVGSLPALPGGAALEARLSSVTANVLAPFVAPETLEQLSAGFEASLNLASDELAAERASGTLMLTRAALVMGGVALEQRRPTRLELRGGRLQIADWDWGGATSNLVLGGEVALAADPALDVTADGRFDLRLLGAFLPGIRTAGEATVRARVDGTGSNPRIGGEIQLAGVEMRIAEPRLVVAGLGGTIMLSNDRITASGITGTANGGTLRLDGDVRHKGFALEGGSLSLTGRGMAVALEGLRAEVDADLSLALAPNETTLAGTVTLARGAYRDPFTLSSGLLAALQQQGQATAREASAADAIRFNVQLKTAEDLLVDNNYARLGIDADLRLVGTLGQPALAGRASVGEGGQIFLGGNVYRIVGRGSVDFTNPTRIEPDLNVTALTRVGRHDITLSIKGTPDRLKTELRSDDPMLGQNDLVSLLVTGRTVEEAGGDQGAVARDQLLGLLAGEFLGSAGRVIGVDTVRLERSSQDLQFDAGLVASETDPGSRLTFGQRVGRNVELVFSQSLAESGGFTWIVGYSPWRSLLLRVVSLDNGGRSYEFRHDLSFGGPTASRPAPRAQAERVAGVRFFGEPEFDDRQLLARLRLSPGDRFDFFIWQRDRDRLEEFYRSRGYLEVRIDATRTTEGNGPKGQQRVRLEYGIDRGPLTRLVLEGHDFPSSVARTMERAWGRSILDEFLLEELRSIARASVARDGYLRAAIDASVAPRATAGEKTIVVRIEPGPRTSDRRIVFRGNERVSASRLAAHAAGQGLDEVAWVRPRELASSLRSFYASEGMLAATVEVAAVEFEDGRATLPVRIDEGRVFEVGEITLEGVSARPEGEVRAELGLATGDTYSAERLQEASRRIDRSYRASGFNDVSVTFGTTVDTENGLVSVTVRIDEGAQQVLGGVVTTGANRTRPSLLTRMLRFDSGTPVNLGDWYEARKRLYDTGAFRRVDIDVEPIEQVATEAGTPGVAPVLARVTLEEVPPLRLRYGFQLNDAHDPMNDTRAVTPGFATDLTARNLFGGATAIGAALRVTDDFRAGRTFLTVPAFFGLPIASNVFLSRSREDLGEASNRPYVVDRTTVTMEQRLRPARNAQVGYGFSFERNHTFDVDPVPGDPLAFDVTVDVAKMSGTALFDSRDDPADPSAGWFVSSAFEYGAGAFGSDLRFVKSLLQQRYYRHVGRGVVAATALRVGLARGFGQQIIPSERFFAGGANSVRGYATDALGPRNFFGDPTGGEALLVLNEEIRFPIGWILRGVAFFDAGNVFSSPGKMSLFDLRSSAGLGLRARTPVGLLRVDFGVPLGRQPGEARGRWFFSIGHAF